MALAPGAEIKLRIIRGIGRKEPDLSGFDYFLTANGSSGYGSMPFENDRFTVRPRLPDHDVLNPAGGSPGGGRGRQVGSRRRNRRAGGRSDWWKAPVRSNIDVVLASDGAFVEGVGRDAE